MRGGMAAKPNHAGQERCKTNATPCNTKLKILANRFQFPGRERPTLKAFLKGKKLEISWFGDEVGKKPKPNSSTRLFLFVWLSLLALRHHHLHIEGRILGSHSCRETSTFSNVSLMGGIFPPHEHTACLSCPVPCVLQPRPNMS